MNRSERIDRIGMRKESRNWMVDSTYWQRVRLRDDDIVICTWPKSGTTWMQQIIGQLLFPQEAKLPVLEMSPWIEAREVRETTKTKMLQKLERQVHRRFMKTHLPADALPLSPEVKYIFVGRDPRDVVWSWYSHQRNLSVASYEVMQNLPGFEDAPTGPPTESAREFFLNWLENDDHPLGSFWKYINSWWNLRQLNNVFSIHYRDLKTNLATGINTIANFLEIDINPAGLPAIVERCSFNYMKMNASALSPLLRLQFKNGASDFIHKGANGRWKDELTQDDIEFFESKAVKYLGRQCTDWLCDYSNCAPKTFIIPKES